MGIVHQPLHVPHQSPCHAQGEVGWSRKPAQMVV